MALKMGHNILYVLGTVSRDPNVTADGPLRSVCSEDSLLCS